MARETSHRPPRGATYHESAVAYNEAMANRARELSAEVEDKEVQRWCRAVARQHDEHTAFHRKALQRLQKQKERKKNQRKNSRNRPSTTKPTVAEDQAEFAAEKTAEPSRPIPRDPRAGKKPDTQQADAGVGTGIDPMDADTNGLGEDPANEKQEASA